MAKCINRILISCTHGCYLIPILLDTLSIVRLSVRYICGLVSFLCLRFLYTILHIFLRLLLFLLQMI